MPLDRPSLTTIRSRIESDVGARLPGIDPHLRRSLLDVTEKALAAAAHELYGHLQTVARDVFPDTARGDALERWADLYEIGRTQGTFASGALDVTGDSGASVPAGTRFLRGDDVEYESTAAATLGPGGASVPVEAVAAGADGNAAAGALVSLVSPLAGVDSTATVDAAGLTGGADQATDAELRAALLARLGAPPQGGSLADYQRWALEVPEVTRRWIFPPAPGDDSPVIGVYFVLDDHPTSIVPDAAKLDEMQDYLEARRAVGQRPVAAAVTLAPLDVTISNLDPDTPEVRAAIAAELADLHLRDAVPGGVILVSRIREAISIAAGESDHELVAPGANVPHATGELPVPGTLTFT